MRALQTRGQAIEKGICCFLGTVVGGLVSIVIVGLFAQTRNLYVVAYSAWLAVCVFAAGFLDGNRAYGAVVCSYTVSIVAVMHVGDPSGLFSEIVNRCAAIAIGIASITLVVDGLAGPAVGPSLLHCIGQGVATMRAFADGLMRDGPVADADVRTTALLSAASSTRCPSRRCGPGTGRSRVRNLGRFHRRSPRRARSPFPQVSAAGPGIPSGFARRAWNEQTRIDARCPGPRGRSNRVQARLAGRIR